jgi:signal transduction histidine kinase
MRFALRVQNNMNSAPEIPWKRVTGFVRQHTHDVRNGLNSLDLETTLLNELVTDGEATASVERIQKQLRALAMQLRSLAALFQDPQPVAAPIPARVLLEIWREKHASLQDVLEVHWVDELGDERVNVDVSMMATVFRELLANATDFSTGDPVTVTARAASGQVLFELREPKKETLDTSTWGQPLSTTRRGGYGLGLWTAHRMMQANGASLLQRHVPEESCLLSQIILPAL